MKKESSPLTDVLEFYGVEMTLTEWLAFNDATDIFDAELLESLPVEFHDEYIDRLRLNAEYEAKFAGQCSPPKA
jgi:hypothetical protein